jgi:hypothetical protein
LNDLGTANQRLSAQGPLLQSEDPMRNPFGVMDVPDPNDEAVMQFAGGATLDGSSDDENASSWGTAGGTSQHDTVEGDWSSRWNGGTDPTIQGDTPDQWKQGRAEAKFAGERVYLMFDWDNGARRGLIDARRDGPQRLVGKYINLNNPEIQVPWVGQVVNEKRIDGQWLRGRLDFRR